MNPAAAVQAFVSIFPAELPDKTALACIVLVGRHRSRSVVFLGVAAAFALHVDPRGGGGECPHPPARPARGAGDGIGLRRRVGGDVALGRNGVSEHGLPTTASRPGPVDGGLGTARAPAGPATGRRGRAGALATPGRWAAVLSSFGVVAIAEFGDLTQVATAGLAVHTGAPLEVAIGSFAALCTVAAAGRDRRPAAARTLRVETLQKVAAALFGLLAVATLAKVF